MQARWITITALACCLASSPAPAAELAAAEAWSKSRLAVAVRDAEPVVRRWGYPVVAAAAALDNIGVPVPAGTILVTATLASLRGDLELHLVVLLAMLGALTGSQIGFGIGRWGGRALLRRLPLAPERVAGVERRYARWGVWVVIAAPFVEGVRQLNAFTAGMLGMPWWRFTLANLAAVLLWAGVWAGATWLVDEHAASVLPVLRAAAPWLTAAACLGLVALLYSLRRKAEPPVPSSR
ncbi:MAG: DedA family protein [Geminicoccaceae bacterium]